MLSAADGFQIIGTYMESTGLKAVILLHMMPEDRSSWTMFAPELVARGYASLAIDERGHGESTMGGTVSYKTFTDGQQQAKILDVEAAIEFLVAEGYAKEHLVIAGASIGANLAIQALARHREIPLAIALSPGLDYHGVLADRFLGEFRERQRVVLVASADDRNSFESVKKLQASHPDSSVLVLRSGIGHGTGMTDADPSLVKELLDSLP